MKCLTSLCVQAAGALVVGALAAGATLFAPAAMAQQGQFNVICSVQADGCNMIQTVFAKTTGIKVNMSLKGSGEALAQLIAERANPKTDVWFGGTGDPHLQAAESDLTLDYRSAALPQLHAWAQQQAAQSHCKTVIEVVPDGQLLVHLRVPRLAHVAGGQVKALLELAMPAQERVLRRIAELTDGQADALVQLDVELHGSKPVLV